MKPSLRPGVLTIASAVVLLNAVTVHATSHQRSFPPNTKNPTCNPGEIEITKEIDKRNQEIILTCAPPSEVDFFSKRADSCRATGCTTNEVGDYFDDLCEPGLAKRLFINNEEIIFVEAVRDVCIGASEQPGVIGIQALCCRKDSTDDVLTTIAAAEPLEFPHFARVGRYGCGGTIINSRWVLTAAHCVVVAETHKKVNKELDDDRTWNDHAGTVRLNIIIRDVNVDRTYNIVEIHTHPNNSYEAIPNDSTRSYNDMALVKLDKDIQFGEHVKPIRIAEKGFDPLKYGDHALLTGFGVTDTKRDALKMQKANLKLRPKKNFHFLGVDNKQIIFAGGIYDDISSVVGTGDSGGPLVCRDSNGLAVLCGVVSFVATATETCVDNLDKSSCEASMFNDVQFFHDWIVKVSGGQNKKDLEVQPIYGEAVGDKYPASQVRVISDEGTCGATMIADDVLITAASCVMNDDGGYKDGLRVAVGVTDAKNGKGEEMGMKTAVVFNDFAKVDRDWSGGARRKRMASLQMEKWKLGEMEGKLMNGSYYRNNVAIVKLTKSSGLQVAKLATEPIETGVMGAEVSFPYKGLGTGSDGSRPLTKRQFKMLDQKACQSRMNRLEGIGKSITLDENVVCGVEWFSGGSMCDREIGGGVYCPGEDGGEEVLCAIQVFRLCEFSIPNEFIDVAKINANWIQNALKQLENV